MCVGGPKIPKPQPLPERQAARQPDIATSPRDEAARRRFGMAAMILTGMKGVAPPTTTRTTLG